MSKKTKKKNQNEIVVRLGLIITVVIFLFIIYKIFDGVILASNRIDLSGENYYQYFAGIKQDYSGEIKITKKNDNTQFILEDGRVVNIDSTPIYYSNVLGKTLFAEEMELVNIDAITYRLDAYTNIIMENYSINIKKQNRENAKRINSNAFIYDGEDLYFFLEETDVKVGKKTYTLSPFSYVKVNYRISVEIYDYEKDKYTMIEEDEDVKADVIAENKYRNYKINMSVDTLSTEKREQLLITNKKNLNSFEY